MMDSLMAKDRLQPLRMASELAPAWAIAKMDSCLWALSETLENNDLQLYNIVPMAHRNLTKAAQMVLQVRVNLSTTRLENLLVKAPTP